MSPNLTISHCTSQNLANSQHISLNLPMSRPISKCVHTLYLNEYHWISPTLQNLTEANHISLSLTKSYIYLRISSNHHISSNVTESVWISLRLTKSRQFYQISLHSLNHTISHYISPNFTIILSHQIYWMLPYLTKSTKFW